jgi:hypothetical protein
VYTYPMRPPLLTSGFPRITSASAAVVWLHAIPTGRQRGVGCSLTVPARTTWHGVAQAHAEVVGQPGIAEGREAGVEQLARAGRGAECLLGGEAQQALDGERVARRRHLEDLMVGRVRERFVQARQRHSLVARSPTAASVLPIGTPCTQRSSPP